MTAYANQPTIKEVKWKDVKEAVAKVNPKFAAVINNMSLSNDFSLYLVRYPFGSLIVKSGVFYVPNEKGQIVPISDPSISDKFRKALNYNNGIPMGVILKKSAELFMQTKEHTIPFGMMKEGKIFALWRILNPSMSYLAPQIWNISSGARDIFFLPKITDTASYKKLAKARNIKYPMPRNLLEQAAILTHLANHKEFSSEWNTEMLFFPNIWLKYQDDDNWIRFHHFLLQEAWENSEHWRNKVVYDFIWDSFVKEITEKNIRIAPHRIDIVKHLIMVGLGVLPGFCPAIDNEAAPVGSLQDEFIDIYDLKRFSPTIMVPHHFSPNEKRPVYWSLQFPTHFESNPKPYTSNSIIEALREIKILLEEFIQAVNEGKLEGLTGTPIPDFFKLIRYDFFHSDLVPNHEDGIRHSKEMVDGDKSLIKCAKKYGHRTFSEISPFVRGCVRISVISSD